MKSVFYAVFVFLVLHSCQPGSNHDIKVQKTQESPAIKAEVTSSPPQRVNSVYIPEQLTFAGENIPIHRNDVREALEYELMVNTFRHSHTMLILKKIERWRGFVSSILKDKNIPEDFIYLAVIESEFDNNAISFAGAMGMWQIMKRTAKEYDLEISKDVDMRRDPKKSTEAAAKYLHWAHSKLNNWVLTAASYNIGVKGISDRLEVQQVESFFDLHLNKETARYIYRILALKLILEKPEAYGYFVNNSEKYTPYKFTEIVIEKDIDNLVDFAKKHNTTYKELRILNPWFNNTHNYKLKASKRNTYEIRIPQETVLSRK